MVSTVEVFDPRVGLWTLEGSMNEARGYFGAIVLRDSIYVLGGLNENGTILDMVCISSRICTLLWHFMLGFKHINSSLFVVMMFVQVEWYEPSHGWRENDLKGFGRRSAFCAAVL